MNKVVHRLKMSIASTAIASTLVVVGGVVVVGTAMGATQTMTTTAMVNVRSGPGSTYSVIKVLNVGDSVTATGSPVSGPSSVGSTWTPVTVNGVKGFVATTYLKAVGAPSDSDSTASGAAGKAVTNAPVNVRTAPSLDSTVLDTLDAGVTVQTTGVVSGTWTQVVFKGAKRWMFSAFLTVGDSESGTVTYGQIRTTDVLYLRAEGSLNGAILGLLPANSVVDVTGKTTDEYTQILYQGKTAWIATRYTTAVSATPLNVVTSLSASQTKLVNYVKSKVGLPYVWGAEGPDSFDCSGLTLAAYKTVGISLPHYSGSQATMGTAVSRDNLQPGDLIFWYSPVSHVSMYIGNGMMVHARNTQVGVVLQSVDSYAAAGAYYQGARRFLK